MMAGLTLGGSVSAPRPCKQEVRMGGDRKAVVISGDDGMGSVSSTWMRSDEKPCSSPQASLHSNYRPFNPVMTRLQTKQDLFGVSSKYRNLFICTVSAKIS